jgi:hypothetical protein
MRQLVNERKKLQVEVYCMAKVYQDNIDHKTKKQVNSILKQMPNH